MKPALRAIATTLLSAALVACSTGGGAPSTAVVHSTSPFAIDEAGGLPDGYKLVWADEFDKPGLPDNEKWTYDIFGNQSGWYNNELQYYALARRENSRVENGVLIIEARRESAEEFIDSKPLPQEFTSARLVTRDRASWTYGFFEVRAKVPCGQGLWPAIWTLADTMELRWPTSGEIDILEHINSEPQVHFSIHTAAHNHRQGTQATRSVPASVCDGEFHNYQMTWTPQEIKIGMDGRNYFRYPNEGRGVEQWPFDGPQYLILNVAVGGDWPGAPTEETPFPQRLEVDYVRVYQK